MCLYQLKILLFFWTRTKSASLRWRCWVVVAESCLLTHQLPVDSAFTSLFLLLLSPPPSVSLLSLNFLLSKSWESLVSRHAENSGHHQCSASPAKRQIHQMLCFPVVFFETRKRFTVVENVIDIHIYINTVFRHIMSIACLNKRYLNNLVSFFI